MSPKQIAKQLGCTVARVNWVIKELKKGCTPITGLSREIEDLYLGGMNF